MQLYDCPLGDNSRPSEFERDADDFDASDGDTNPAELTLSSFLSFYYDRPRFEGASAVPAAAAFPSAVAPPL